jgi:hypothetical protein
MAGSIFAKRRSLYPAYGFTPAYYLSVRRNGRNIDCSAQTVEVCVDAISCAAISGERAIKLYPELEIKDLIHSHSLIAPEAVDKQFKLASKPQKKHFAVRLGD